jgi:PAS domain S-box-containing protein
VPNDVTHGDEEIRHLRSSINDLISIQALPTIWDGRESGSIVSTLLDVLVSMLQLDFAYVRLSDSINGSPVEFVRLAQRRAPPPQTSEIGRALDRWLTNPSVNAPLVVPNPAGDGEVKIAPLRLGLTDEIGALVASSKRANFPTPTETLLLRTAANQALAALQEARQLREQKRSAEELERRVADRTAQLTAANEALGQSEKKYRTLFDSIDEGFSTIEVLFDEKDNPIDYRFLEVNPSFEKQTGIQNARGRRMREIAPHHEDHWFEIYGRIALTGEPARFESQAAQLHRWYDVYAFRVGEAGDRKVAILFKDVTERKRAEEALRRSESYLAEAQRLSHTGSWARVCATGEIKYLSEEYYRVIGFEPHDGQPRLETFLQRVHPEDRAKVRETVSGPGNVDYDLDYRVIHPSGEIRHIHTIGHPVFSPSGDLVEFVGTVMDVTERKLSEALLSSEKHLLEMIAGGAPLPAVLNDLCGAIDEQSPGLISTVLSLDADGQRLWPVAGPGVPEGWTRMVSPLAIGPCAGSCGTAAYRKETVVVSDIATDPLWADFREGALSYGLKACWSKPIISTTGSVLGTFATYYGEIRSPGKRELLLIERATHIAHIAIERDKTQDSLRKAQANLAHATRVSTMGELTASIAHEVNQPLAGVVNNANACISLLPAGDTNLEEVREALGEIIDDAERASDVIARVRQLARKAPVERVPLDFRDVIADVMALARHESATRRVIMHAEIPRDPPLVLGDRVQLQQVLLNLVVNGMDAMNAVDESKRVLFIRGHRETRDGRIETLVSVQDAGTGFKPEEMGRLFEAFYTTKPQGMGMGLAISRSIIEAHGGRLWAEPNQGPGATFLFSLPFAGNAAS